MSEGATEDKRHKLNTHAWYHEDTDGIRVVAWKSMGIDHEPVVLETLVPWRVLKDVMVKHWKQARHKRKNK